MSAEDRQARPASPVERTQNHLNKYKIHIYCDLKRYNEATHVQARYVDHILYVHGGCLQPSHPSWQYVPLK